MSLDDVWRAAAPFLRIRKNDIHVPISFDYAERPLEEHPQADELVVRLAILLHDIGWYKIDEADIFSKGFGENCSRLHQQLRERGIAIDILINNAGHGLQGPFLDGQLNVALGMVQLDVASLTAVTHVFAQDMRTRKRGKILLVASLLAYQRVQNFAVYAAAKAYVLRLGEALHRELKSDGITVTALCPGMSDTGFATAAQQKITPALKRLMMQPVPVVRAGIRALYAGRISIVPGFANK
jgi:uncharacterized protein